MDDAHAEMLLEIHQSEIRSNTMKHQLKISKQNIENTTDLYDVFNGVEMYMNFYIDAYEAPSISPNDVRNCDNIAKIVPICISNMNKFLWSDPISEIKADVKHKLSTLIDRFHQHVEKYHQH